MTLAPVELSGSIVHLQPLKLSDAGLLAAVGFHPELWRLQPKAITTAADMQAYVDTALDEQTRGVSLPFLIVHLPTNSAIGSTRFMDIALPHRRLEIGCTWLTPTLQRSGANVEAKLLLLTHAFEALNIQKVVLKTETLNAQSRKAILALGAVEEGTFMQHFISDTGRVRDMVYFGLFSSDWPEIKARLTARLQSHRTSPG